MTKPIDNIFAIKNEGGKNTDMENTTDSSPNNYIKEECNFARNPDPRC